MEAKEFSAKTTEAAIALAMDHFALSIDRLQIEVISTGSSGLLGIFGAKKAVIKAFPSGPSAEDDLAEAMSGFTGKAPPKPKPKPKPKPAPVPAPVPTPQSAEPKADQEQAPAWLAAKSEPIAPALQPNPPQEAPPEPRQQQEPQDRPQSPEPRPERAHSRRQDESPEVVEAALVVLKKLVLPLDQGASVEARSKNGAIELDITGEEAGILIGRRGQTLDAMQYLTVRIVSHQEGRPVRINVDAGGYRRRRRQSLEELALRMAEKARHTRRSVAIGPLAAPERRLVHLALKEARDLTTQSRGRGELKKVVIIPR